MGDVKENKPWEDNMFSLFPLMTNITDTHTVKMSNQKAKSHSSSSSSSSRIERENKSWNKQNLMAEGKKRCDSTIARPFPSNSETLSTIYIYIYMLYSLLCSVITSNQSPPSESWIKKK